MEVAFLSTCDPFDVHHQSGMPFNMRVHFESLGMRCHYLQSDRNWRVRMTEQGFRVRDRLGRRLGLAFTDVSREPAILKAHAASLSRKIRELKPDIVFSSSSLPVAFLDVDRPIAFWTDCTFGGMIDFYPEFTNLPASVKRAGWIAEDAALRNCTFAMYASDWAAQTAIDLHKADPHKIKVVLRSANVEPLAGGEVTAAVQSRSRDRVQLLFLGKDWARKGGDCAYEVAKLLNERAVPTDLTVIGCNPDLLEPHPSWLKILGYISKATAEGRLRIESVLASSHFLVVPSVAECSGIASTEAAACGVPALVTRVGGCQSAVHDGINGMTFDAPARPEEIADYIEALFTDRRKYEDLAHSAHNDFCIRQSWPVIAGQVKQLMEQHIPSSHAPAVRPLTKGRMHALPGHRRGRFSWLVRD